MPRGRVYPFDHHMLKGGVSMVKRDKKELAIK